MPIPIDKDLYEEAKSIVYEKYKKPSAYRSGALQKKYKELGGRYEGDKSKGNLTRWFQEEWMDVGGKEYPVYRPTIKVNEKTPLTVDEIEPKSLKKQIKLKQKIKGEKNLPPFEEEGGKINFQIIKRKAKNTIKDIKNVFSKRTSGLLPPKVRQFLEKNGTTKINSAKVVRCPIESAIKYLLNFISLGSYEDAVRQANYDKMFHLALVLNGNIVFDKQEVIKMVIGNPIKKDCEVLEVPLNNKDLTLNELVEKTREYMGDDKFTNYNAKSNNCQDFILGILNGNGLISPQLIDFIKQDANAVFNRLPKYTEKIATAFTDLGAVANKLIEGQNINPKSKMPYDIKKISRGHYEVLNKETGQIHSKGTSLKKAKAQVRLLMMIHNKKIGGDLIEGDYQLIKNGDCWTVYNRLNQKIIEPCLPTEQKGKDLIQELLKLDETKELKELAFKHRENLRKDTIKKLNLTNNKKMETWREFYSKKTKGKKFGSRAEVNAWMKQCSAEYKKMKSK